MAIDLRAKATCTLGELISASISDSSIIGAGLIKTSGSCQISGLVNPGIGTIVKIFYEKSGIVRELPRHLVVLSSFANPFTNTTVVDLGCQLTYMDGVSEPRTIDGFQDPANSSFGAADKEIVIIPISASAVAQECLEKIGLTGSPPLTNKFSVEKFDLSAGYVSVLNDLLLSESLCGFVDKNGNFITFSLSATTGIVPLIEQDQIVELGPLSPGQLPGNPVIVDYSTLKLRSPDPIDAEWEELRARRDWELEESYDSETEVILRVYYNFGPWFGSSLNKPPRWPPANAGQTVDVSFFYVPKTVTRTTYDKWDRVVTRRTVKTTIAAESNPDQTTDLLSFSNLTSFGMLPVESSTVTTITYKKAAPLVNPVVDGREVPAVPEEGYDEVLLEETITYEPDHLRYAGLPVNYYALRSQGIVLNPVLQEVPSQIAERRTVQTETYARDLVLAVGRTRSEVGYFPITKTTTRNWRQFGKTAKGQKYFRTLLFSPLTTPPEGPLYGYDPRLRPDVPFNLAQAIVNVYGLLKTNREVSDGTQVRIFSGREAVFQGRPASSSRISGSLAEGTDPNNGYRTDSSSEVEFVYGTETAGYDRPTQFSIPYAPDDVFVKTGSGPSAVFAAISSDAPQKVVTFGRIQNKLLFGANYGIEIQTAGDRMPPRPYTTFCIQAGGLTGSFVTDGTSWVIDGNGIIASTSALYTGIVGIA